MKNCQACAAVQWMLCPPSLRAGHVTENVPGYVTMVPLREQDAVSRNARGTRCPCHQTWCVWKAQLWQENIKARSGLQI